MTLLAALALAQLGNSALVAAPVDSDWWKTRHLAATKRAQKGNVDLVFVGDSITHAFGGEPDTQQSFSNRGGDTWNLFYGHRKAMNLGFSGDRTGNVLWRLDNGELDGVNPKVAVVMIGTNNVGGNTASQIAEGIQAVCRKIKEKCPKTRVLLLGIFPRGTATSSDRGKVLNANRALADWAKSTGEVEFQDIGDVFLDARGEIPKDIMPDMLHPFALGYRKWAMAMEPYLAKMLGDKPVTTYDPRNSAVVPDTQNRDYPLYDWMPRHQEVLNYHAKNKPNLVFIGDSITHYFGGPPVDDQHKRGTDVWNFFFGFRKASNLGFGWDRTENVLWRLEHGELDGIAPRAVVLLIGTNNLDVNTPAEIRDGIAAVLDLIRAKQPKSKIVLLGVLPRGQTPDNPYRAKIADLNALLPETARAKGALYLDLSRALLESDGTIAKETMSDFLHPTARGYRRLAEALEPTLRDIFHDVGSGGA